MSKPEIAVIIDTETSGIDITKDDVIQVAGVLADVNTGKATTLMLSYCRPLVPIAADAQAIHGISEETVAYAPPSRWALRTLGMLLQEVSESRQVVLVGHNSERFDIPLMDRICPEGLFTVYPHIDTYTLALRMFPDAYKKFENAQEYKPHKLERLYEWYAGGKAVNAHDAAADCHMAAAVLGMMLQDLGMTLGEAAEYCRLAKPLTCMPYGKHGGTPWNQVPKGYLSYARRNWSDTHKDVWLSIMMAIGEAA
jgi:exodeoxyribonuclease X